MKKINKLPSQEVLQRTLDYDPETGRLYWKNRDDRRFDSRWSGKQAFTSINQCGYNVGVMFGEIVSAHRVVWKLLTGEDPLQIDHINGIPSDNRVENLRNVSNTENSKNKKLFSNNTSGFSGVCFYKRYNKWVAKIGGYKNRKTIGYFHTKEEAITARLEAEVENGYHENHGKR